MIRELRRDFERNERWLSRIQVVPYLLGNWAFYDCRTPGVKQACYFVYKVLNIGLVIALGSSEVNASCRIGSGWKLPHGLNGIVINGNTIIGENATIYHQVSVGTREADPDSDTLVPRIGRDVTIYAGAKVIGPITVGDGAVIGANAVVLSDVPPFAVMVGVPARVAGDARRMLHER